MSVMDVISFIGMNLFLAGIFFLLRRLRSRRTRPSERLQVLHYPWLVRLVAAVGMALFGGGLLFVCRHTSGAERWQCIAYGGPFLLLVLAGAAEVFIYEISYDEAFISRTSPWSGMLLAGVDEIRAVTYSSRLDQYLVRTAAGTIRVSRYLSGAEGFIAFAVATLDRKVPG